MTKIIFLLVLLVGFSLPVIPQKKFTSHYVKPASEGLFYGPENTFHALVLSSDNRPIPQKANDPDAPTVPGLYRTYDSQRLRFERVEIFRKLVYFRARAQRGFVYEYRGRIGQKIDHNFSDTIPIPFIKGKMTTKKNGKIIKVRTVVFEHAVIA